MYDVHTKELINNENGMADTTNVKITTSPTNSITFCEDISRAIQIEPGLLNDEIVKNRLEEILQYMKSIRNLLYPTDTYNLLRFRGAVMIKQISISLHHVHGH